MLICRTLPRNKAWNRKLMKLVISTVTELQTVVENKVDTAAVEALETELRTYIDEVINNVEAGDMDGGVIE